MNKPTLFFILVLFPRVIFGQITDASFFPAMRSINPGVAHLRKVGFISVDVNKKDIKKKHEVTAGNLVDGIKTNTTLTKGTLFWGAKGGGWVTPVSGN